MRRRHFDRRVEKSAGPECPQRGNLSRLPKYDAIFELLERPALFHDSNVVATLKPVIDPFVDRDDLVFHDSNVVATLKLLILGNVTLGLLPYSTTAMSWPH